MDEEEDDLYAPSEPTKLESPAADHAAMAEADGDESMDEDDDDEEEEDDEEDSDIEIVTETKESAKSEPASARKLEAKADKSAPPRIDTPTTAPSKAAPAATPALPDGNTPAGKQAAPLKPGSEYPGIHSSTIDVDAVPILDATGKSVFKTDMDADFGEDDKPWRRPGIDQTDFFNYGFDEFTWASYCLKQETLRAEAKDQKTQVEEMQKMFGMPGGSASNAGGNTAAASGGAPGMEGFPPEMMGMMQQMMASGVDPTQMDFNQFMQMGGAQGGVGGGGGPGPGFAPTGPGGGGGAAYGGYGQGGGSGGGGRHGGRRRW